MEFTTSEQALAYLLEHSDSEEEYNQLEEAFWNAWYELLPLGVCVGMAMLLKHKETV